MDSKYCTCPSARWFILDMRSYCRTCGKEPKVLLWPLWLIIAGPLIIGFIIKLIRHGLD